MIAPCASLPLGVEPAAAMKNLRRLAVLEDSALLGEYGYIRSDRLFATDGTRRRGGNYHPLLHGSSPGNVAAGLWQRLT